MICHAEHTIFGVKSETVIPRIGVPKKDGGHGAK
jgi:hypothetical protein